MRAAIFSLEAVHLLFVFLISFLERKLTKKNEDDSATLEDGEKFGADFGSMSCPIFM